MAMNLVFAPNPIQQRDPRLARHFEQVVSEVLRAAEALCGGGPVAVRFHAWDGDDAARYVCKVECSDGPGLEMGEPPWRWWSGLVETPQELAQALGDALRAQSRRRARNEEPREAAAVERWGWAGELQLS
jgi:hypothetical protein